MEGTSANQTTNIILGVIAGVLVLAATYWLGREQGMTAASASFSTSISAASLASSASNASSASMASPAGSTASLPGSAPTPPVPAHVGPPANPK